MAAIADAFRDWLLLVQPNVGGVTCIEGRAENSVRQAAPFPAKARRTLRTEVLMVGP